ncbi:sensor histidine kinase [uncultured Sphaerochaeta sp.]|uniref:cache domain-containing sensor histidine kinase n=1 Tax=uncultured Sphaerochaeta sp. TaxID=886478 RepID=UPI0029CA2B1F|nr:sensor histidine kinase [uncultured Sphaerochaeta sp.]
MKFTWGNHHKPNLFTLLFLYFLIVLIVPLGLFSAYYALAGNTNQERYLMRQAMNMTTRDASTVAQALESYRHKAYQLSTNPLVVEILKADILEAESSQSRELYELLFTVMHGDIYLASANLVSNSGKVRVSTHVFPEVYDLRYQGNDWDMASIINQNSQVSPTASLISIQSHRIAENGRQVVASILRRVYDQEGTNLGYLVVDMYADALSPQVNSDHVLTDMLLVDTKSFYATSLVHPERFGSFDRFPALNSLEGDYTPRSLPSDTSIIAISPIGNTGLHLVGSLSSAPFFQSMENWLSAFSTTMIIGVVLALGLSYLFSRSIARPIKNLAKRMREVEQGELEHREVSSAIREFSQLEHSFNVMIKQIISLLDLTREEQAKLSEAERKALESQMNPHFLFNTLNTIKALARLHGEEDIYTITVKLGKLLRSSIDNRESEATLEQSMALIESYLTIQKLRFADKLTTEIYLDPSCKHIKTPKLIIQPLVENAIIHGLEPKVGSWNLSVRVERTEERISITVVDDGVGFPPDRLPDNLDELANSPHVGVYNVYRRLFLKYGRKLHFSLKSKEGEGTWATISFPDEEAIKEEMQ